MNKLKENKNFYISVLGILLVLITGVIATVSLASIQVAAKTFLAVVSVLSVLIIGFAIYWAKINPTEKKIKRGILSTLLSVGLIIIIMINLIIPNYVFLGSVLFAKPDVNTNVEAASRKMTEKIADEGFVLLENKNNVLPLDITNEMEKKINVFGQASVKMVYGGIGSGAGDESNNLKLQKGLENNGFELNGELTAYYKENKPEEKEIDIHNLEGGDFSLSEPILGDSLLDGAKDFSDVAVITLARSGGEGGDLPFDMSDHGGSADHHYLELSEAEEDMIDNVISMDFKKVIVVINSSHPMELDFLEKKV